MFLDSGGSHHDKNAKTTDSHKGLSSVTVMLITIPIVWLLVVVVFGGWSFYQRRQSSPRSEAVSTMTDHSKFGFHLLREVVVWSNNLGKMLIY